MACHTQRWWALLCTKLHLASTSAASTRRTSTVIAPGPQPSTTLLFTWDSPAAFFYFAKHGIGPDMQDAGNIADPTPLERHVHDLPLHRRQTAGIGRAAYKCPPTLRALLTTKP